MLGVRAWKNARVLPRPDPQHLRPPVLQPFVGIDYVIGLGCVPKQQFGSEGLYRRLVRLAEEPGPAAVEAAFELRPLAFHCSGCAANHSRLDFGCYGTVSL